MLKKCPRKRNAKEKALIQLMPIERIFYVNSIVSIIWGIFKK